MPTAHSPHSAHTPHAQSTAHTPHASSAHAAMGMGMGMGTVHSLHAASVNPATPHAPTVTKVLFCFVLFLLCLIRCLHICDV